MIGLLTISIPSIAFADAGASAKNKCRNGKRYKSKAKVNGPNSCQRERYVDKNCSSATSEAVLYRQSTENCTCIGSEWTPSAVTGAYAYAHASAAGITSTSYKTNSCSGYKAGGAPTFVSNKASKFEGAVRAESGFSDLTFDYDDNSITLSDFKSLLQINSEDFINEYSIVQISVDVVKEDANGDDILSNILFAQATFKDGRIVFLGDVFNLSDFKMIQLENGIEYNLNSDQKTLNLGTDIDESMVIEVTINTDAGNILDGASEIERSSVTMDASFNVTNDNVLVKLNSNESLSGVLEIRDLYGVKLHDINSINLSNGIQSDLEISKSVFSKHGNYFILLLRLSNGQVVTADIIVQ